ncbi:molybdopterin-dependent oxidoreductase [Desmospora profundinema]|uniref:Anaerobic selenocysteine-containing dehydrogenase n=1 Tax=Desmospora profundinema TaxID=1571184 RepID=A0ABU1IN97_9BACL|nr:molybdopterin-dependent oxidoreductase [Desmospora profundinema]MDR6226208.1 anaerobic selenocysteine-containing dehydrogenase [Desmospora profundinema]
METNQCRQIDSRVSFRTCPLCEATCGLEIHVHGEGIEAIQGDKKDPFSQGYLCPKGVSLKELHTDPDRIRTPMIRRGTKWVPATWDEAFSEVKKGLRNLIDRYGADAVGVYLGNPNVHNLSNMLYMEGFLRMLRTRNLFSASSMDQMPKQLAAEIMFGHSFNVPIPDVDRTDYLLIIGANPLASNGSLMTAPNMRRRLKGIQQRGGKVVVIDPVHTPTAKLADEHYFIRPGADAWLLLAIIHTLFDEDWVSTGKLGDFINGMEEIQTLVREFQPEEVSAYCGIPAETIRLLARNLGKTPRAVVYGRMGTCTQRFGTVNSWLIDVINVLTGNLDREGGAMFPRPATGPKQSIRSKGPRFGRYHSRVRKLPEVFGELPVACMAEEMEVAGPGQIRGLITIAGNPVLSSPNGSRLLHAMENLEFMVSIDCYLNETTRHAHVLLPPLSPLEKAHYDLVFYQFSVRNIAKYSRPVFDRAPDQLDEWEILLHLAAAVSDKDWGENPVKTLDDLTVMKRIQKETKNENSPIHGRDPKDIMAELGNRRGPERLLDWMLRMGPYGEGFGANSDGLTLSLLENNPHGIDLGPLTPRLPGHLLTPSGKIELAPPVLVKDVERLCQGADSKQNGFRLVGRRDLRSNNSWMHNLPVLVKGKNRCTLWIHPDDANRLGLIEGDPVSVSSQTGRVEVIVHVTSDVMPGVVSLPHGWGHRDSYARLTIAKEHPGINVNILTDDQDLDPVSGTVVLNDVPVEITK